MSNDQTITVRVIPWDGLWGAAISRGRKHSAYPVGSREKADAEAERLRQGGELPPFPPIMAQAN